MPVLVHIENSADPTKVEVTQTKTMKPETHQHRMVPKCQSPQTRESRTSISLMNVREH